MEEDQVQTLFTKVNIGPGIILSYNDSDLFYAMAHDSFNRFAMEIARSPLYLGDLKDHKIRSQKRIDSFNEMGYDMSDIDIEMQARYIKVLEDCLDKFATIIMTMVENQYTKESVIKRI